MHFDLRYRLQLTATNKYGLIGWNRTYCIKPFDLVKGS